jgi:hypothetical protein
MRRRQHLGTTRSDEDKETDASEGLIRRGGAKLQLVAFIWMLMAELTPASAPLRARTMHSLPPAPPAQRIPSGICRAGRFSHG